MIPSPIDSIQLIGNQLYITMGGICTFNYSTAITVGATTGQYTIAVYDVTGSSGALVYSVSPTPLVNTSSNYILTAVFNATVNHGCISCSWK